MYKICLWILSDPNPNSLIKDWDPSKRLDPSKCLDPTKRLDSDSDSNLDSDPQHNNIQEGSVSGRLCNGPSRSGAVIRIRICQETSVLDKY